MKGLQKDIKFQWVPFYCGVVGNEMADYLAKRGITISQTSACKLALHSAKLRINRNFDMVTPRCDENTKLGRLKDRQLQICYAVYMMFFNAIIRQ